MILTPEDVRKVRPIAENINDPARLMTYLAEAENLRLIDAIGASLYQWLDETDFSMLEPFIYTTPDGKEVEIDRTQYDILMYGGYYPGCKCDCTGKLKKTVGLVASISYIAYSRFIVNNPINTTAFGVVHKMGEFSAQVNDSILIRTSNEARKIGEAYLQQTIECLEAFGLLTCSCCGGSYKESPRRMIRIGNYKL